MKNALELLCKLAFLGFALWGMYHLLGPFATVVDENVALAGRVSGIRTQRQRHTHRLARQGGREYDFNRYALELPLAEMVRRHYDSWSIPDVADYLEPGDSLYKAAHSPRLTVWRGRAVTHWILAEYEPMPPDNPR